MEQTALIDFLTSIVGEIPPELESLVYVICVVVLLYIVDQFFSVLSAIFGVSKWMR